MKKVALLFFLTGSWLNLIGKQEIIITESSDSPLAQLVNHHMVGLVSEYFHAVSLEDWHILANVILNSYTYTQLNFQYNKTLTKVLKIVWKLKINKDELQAIHKKLKKLVEKLNTLAEKRTKAYALWRNASSFLDQPEQKNVLILFEVIANQRVQIIQEYLHNNELLLFNSCQQVYDVNIKLATRINSIGHVFKALLELPYNGEMYERAFAVLNSAFSMVNVLEKEQPHLIESIEPILQHVEDITLMNITLDALYYAHVYELLKNYSFNECYQMFNYAGVIPVEQRREELPAINR